MENIPDDPEVPGHPVQGARGVFGAVLDFSPGPRRPPDFEAQFAKAFRAGHKFGQDAQLLHWMQVHDDGKRKLRQSGFKLRRPNFGNAWDDIYGAAFWFGAQIRCEEIGRDFGVVRTHAALFGARCQRNLTRALVTLPPDEREHIYHAIVDADASRLIPWGVSYKGAISVARVAEGFNAKSRKIILPSVHVDMLYKVDLLVEMEAEPKRYLCLQIKARREALDICILLTEPLLQENPALSDQLETLHSIQKFAHDYDVLCVPAFIQLAKGRTPWDIGLPSTLQLALRVLLQQAEGPEAFAAPM